MHRVKVMDAEQEQQISNKKIKSYKKKKLKTIKINDELFEIGLRKGLIEKNEDGYYFIGDSQELLEFKNIKISKSYELSDWSEYRGGGLEYTFDSPLLVSQPPLLPPFLKI